MGLKNFPGYRPQTSILRTVDEPKMKKKFNWDRLMFIILLMVVAFFGFRRFYRSFAEIRVNGQVILDKMSVNFTDDIRIKKMLVNEGDEVNAGDTLFNYVLEEANPNSYVSTYNKYDGNSNWYVRERMAVTRQIELKKSQLAGLRTLIRLKETELENLKQRVYLGTELSNKIDPLEAKILELKNEVAALDSEMAVLKHYLGTLMTGEIQALEAEQERISAEIQAKSSFSKLILHYTTPIAGLIGQIEKQENEVCYESESVMTIHRMGAIKVKAYFSPEFADDIKIGDEVLIIFDDGSQTVGLIQNFYISTYPLPPEFQKRYEPVTRSIVADVVPKDTGEAGHWLGYYKMSVQVVKNRFPFF